MPSSAPAAARLETVYYLQQPLQYHLYFRPRRTLGFVVRPDGSVHISAPRGTTLAWVAAQVLRKAPWILKHQTAFQQRPVTAPTRHYGEGATHYFLGQPYALRQLEGAVPGVGLVADTLCITSPTALSPTQVATPLDRWYTQQAAAQFAQAFEQVWPLFAEFNLPRPTLLVRPMRTRWGSCTPRTGRIRLSRDLVRASFDCIVYVLLHECCHLLVPNHSQAFYDLQTRLLPDWPQRKAELNALPK